MKFDSLEPRRCEDIKEIVAPDWIIRPENFRDFSEIGPLAFLVSPKVTCLNSESPSRSTVVSHRLWWHRSRVHTNSTPSTRPHYNVGALWVEFVSSFKRKYSKRSLIKTFHTVALWPMWHVFFLFYLQRCPFGHLLLVSLVHREIPIKNK